MSNSGEMLVFIILGTFLLFFFRIPTLLIVVFLSACDFSKKRRDFFPSENNRNFSSKQDIFEGANSQKSKKSFSDYSLKDTKVLLRTKLARKRLTRVIRAVRKIDEKM